MVRGFSIKASQLTLYANQNSLLLWWPRIEPNNSELNTFVSNAPWYRSVFFLEGFHDSPVCSSNKSNISSGLEERKRKEKVLFLRLCKIKSTSYAPTRSIYHIAYMDNIQRPSNLEKIANSRKKCAFHFLVCVSVRNFLLLLTILPADSDLTWKPPNVWHLCSSLANRLAPLFLLLLQGGYSETRIK